MDDRTRENWRKVYEALKAAGRQNSFFFYRAEQIVRTGHDPGNNITNGAPEKKT